MIQNIIDNNVQILYIQINIYRWKRKNKKNLTIYMHIWIQRTININIILTDIKKRYKKVDMIFIHYKQNQNYKISYFYLRLLTFYH